MTERRGRDRRAAVLLSLVVLHFVVPALVDEPRMVPDFLVLALLLYAIQARPGAAAAAGFGVGLVADALTPVAFGAGALAHTVVGYLAAWGKAVFFAENVAVNAGFIFVGVWVRDVVVLMAGRPADNVVLLWQLLFWSPVKALITALVGLVILLLFRGWLAIRIPE